MKRLSFMLWLTMSMLNLPAQPVQATIKKGLPDFVLQLFNGGTFRTSDLNKGQPVMLVYFDPDCDHCKLFIGDLLKHINAFNQVQILMITYVPIRYVQSFCTNLELGKYPDIKAGTEGTSFVVRYHYNIIQFPYLALHDRNGNLFATYESEVPTPEQLAAMFKK